MLKVKNCFSPPKKFSMKIKFVQLVEIIDKVVESKTRSLIVRCSNCLIRSIFILSKKSAIDPYGIMIRQSHLSFYFHLCVCVLFILAQLVNQSSIDSIVIWAWPYCLSDPASRSMPIDVNYNQWRKEVTNGRKKKKKDSYNCPMPSTTLSDTVIIDLILA